MTDIRDRGHRLRFGVVTPQMWRSWDEMLELWSRVEDAGWDAAFMVDHFISDWDGELGDNLEAPFEPKPVRGRLPVAVGSRRPRMLDILSRFGDYWDAAGTIDDVLRTGEILDNACRRHGRDPDDIVWMHEEVAEDSHATVEGLADRVAAMSAVGVSFFLVNVWPRSDSSAIERLGDGLQQLREKMA